MLHEELGRGGEKIGPILLRPIFQERIWGAETLPEWYPQPQAGKPIGEAWLTAESCVVDAGAFQGRSLGEMTAMYPEAFGGGGTGEFPLLIKTLFPREKLSVQVHPNDAEARLLGERRGKTECWYVLSAEAGATVAVGLREGVSVEEVRSAIAEETLEEKLRYLPVKAGDMVYVDAGTIHAIGPAMVVLETQEYSDITYRLYDYGRPRELHVDAGLKVSRTKTKAGLVAPVEMEGCTRLVRSEYFEVDRISAGSGGATLGDGDRMRMLFAKEEGTSVEGAAGTVSLKPGSIVVLPAEGAEYALRGVGDVIMIALP